MMAAGARASSASTGATCRLPRAAGAVRRDGRARCPGRATRGVNVTIPHKVAALELADERDGAAAAIGAANTLSFDDGRIEADNTDAGGLLDALGEPRRRASGRSCWARAAPAARRPGRCGTRAPRWRSGTGRLNGRRSWRARWRSGTRAASKPLTCSSTPRRSGCRRSSASTRRSRRSTSARVGGAVACWSTSYTATEPTALCAWAERRGARVVDGLEVLVRQGARSLERWTGRDAPLEVMRAAAGSDT